MSIKLGIAPIAWSNDDMPELGGETTLEQCLSEASKAGFTGIESGGKFPKNSKELIPKLEKENLQLCSGWYGATSGEKIAAIDIINIKINPIKPSGCCFIKSQTVLLFGFAIFIVLMTDILS